MQHYYTIYNERWFIRFKDYEGGDWRISIGDPTFTGTATELTGAENPFEWMGEGSEEPTDCICGSTGYLRIVVKNNDEVVGLRPICWNDRRVIATRTQNGSSSVMWQGFIKTEEYDQDWKGTPYELEFPIASVLSLADSIYMYDPYSNMPEVDLLKQRRTILGLLRMVKSMIGIQLEQIITNNPIYKGFRGEMYDTSNNIVTSTDSARHWLENKAWPYYFYDKKGMIWEPQTLKDVLECIFYPYGHIREMGTAWFVGMWKENTDLWIYDFNYSAGSRFTHSTAAAYTSKIYYMGNVDHAMYIQSAGTNNTVTHLSVPKKLKYKTSNSEKETIFELTKDNILPGFSLSEDVYYGNTALTGEGNGFGVAIIDSTFIKGHGSLINAPSYTRILKKEKTESGSSIPDHGWSEFIPLCVRLKDNESFNFFPFPGIISPEYYTLNLKMYDKYANADVDQYGLQIQIITTLSDGTKAYYKGFSDEWTSTPWTIACNYMLKDGNSRYLDFRFNNNGNQAVLGLEIKVICLEPGNTPRYIVPKLAFKYNDSSFRQILYDGISENYETVTTEGNGSSIDVEFKTLCSINAVKNSVNPIKPQAGFCDQYGLISTKKHKKLEIAECRHTDQRELQLHHFLAVSNNEIMYPLAVGMNARNYTTQLRLITIK